MIRIIHYREKCIGCNACVEVAPDRWRMSRTDGKSTLVGGVFKKGIQSALINNIELDENRKAAESCPAKVIRLETIAG